MQYRILPVLALGLAVLSSAAPATENLNTTRMARLDEHFKYNDVWGYVAPDGREYAVLGCKNGTAIINATNPLEPYEVAFFGGPECTWRDVKSWGSYIYEGSECDTGVRVFDMSDPEAPVEVGRIGTFFGSHNIQIDQDTGLLYVVGNGEGIKIWDLSTDPVDPEFIQDFYGLVSTEDPGGYLHDGGPNYVHDLYVARGMAHVAALDQGRYYVLDVSNPFSISVMDDVQSGAAFTHSTWTNADDTIAVVADENALPRHLSFYDISDPTDIVKHSSFTVPGTATVHNPYILGEFCHVSWYDEGYVVVDFSDPTLPARVAQFDTTPNDGGPVTIDGAWGCYPFQPSGFVYISDILNGLYILKPRLGCEEDRGGLPRLCEVWPQQARLVDSPRQPVILTGTAFDTITEVQVGDVVLPASSLWIKKDQNIIFDMPVVSQLGMVDIVVRNALGDSETLQIEVLPPEGVVLDTGGAEAEVGGQLEAAMGSAPGNLHYLVAGFTDLPSVAPGVVAFDIGNGFNDLLWMPVTTANAAGGSSLSFPVPVEGLGVEVFWQLAVVTPGVGPPATVSEMTSTVLVEASEESEE